MGSSELGFQQLVISVAIPVDRSISSDAARQVSWGAFPATQDASGRIVAGIEGERGTSR